ncbi:MAG: SRPBCC family protein [Gammaproteobacteria bacterium]|nr:SRPBCC family protein [Gammaproteobacteria bacterium]
MFKTIAIVIVVLIAAVLIYAATKPDSFSVQRSARIKAAPDKIFAFITDFHRWGAWSPYEKIDPGMKRTFSGAPAGKGAVYEWDGNGRIGQGRMEITAATPPSKIAIQLDFFRPFKANSMTEFAIEPQGDTTNVTWTMSGPQPFMAKVMSIFCSMDKMVGKDFDAGLADLKVVAEK